MLHLKIYNMKQLRVYNYPIDDSEAMSLMRLYHTCDSNDCLSDDVANKKFLL